MNFHVFSTSNFCIDFSIDLFFGGPKIWPKWLQSVFRRSTTFGSLFGPYRFFDALWSPFGSLLAPFGSILVAFGSILVPFGSILAPFWLHFGYLFAPLAPFWHPFRSIFVAFLNFESFCRFFSIWIACGSVFGRTLPMQIQFFGHPTPQGTHSKIIRESQP